MAVLSTPKPAPPVLEAYRSLDGIQLCVFCPNCLYWHYHGGGGDPQTRTWRPGDGDGHRVAHCGGDLLRGKPQGEIPSLRRSGYFLREAGTITADIVKAHKCRRGYASTKPRTNPSAFSHRLPWLRAPE